MLDPYFKIIVICHAVVKALFYEKDHQRIVTGDSKKLKTTFHWKGLKQASWRVLMIVLTHGAINVALLDLSSQSQSIGR